MVDFPNLEKRYDFRVCETSTVLSLKKIRRVSYLYSIYNSKPGEDPGNSSLTDVNSRRDFNSLVIKDKVRV